MQNYVFKAAMVKHMRNNATSYAAPAANGNQTLTTSFSLKTGWGGKTNMCQKN